jgi:hypothetical protein
LRILLKIRIFAMKVIMQFLGEGLKYCMIIKLAIIFLLFTYRKTYFYIFMCNGDFKQIQL